MFREISTTLKSTYNSANDNIVREFYNPILANSLSYQRVSGFFSVESLAMYANGIDLLADAGGHIRFIISTQISRDDFKQIKNGYMLRDALGASFEEISEDEKAKLGNLAYLILIGAADVRFGVRERGLFHSKWGYFEDRNGDDIYFIGSNNETRNGIANSYEDFDVDFSWDPSPNVRQRIAAKKRQFERLWSNKDGGALVIPANEIVYDMLREFDKGHIQSLPGRDLNALVLDKSGKEIRFVDHTQVQILHQRSLQRRIEFYVEKSDTTSLRSDLKYMQIDELINTVRKFAKGRGVRFFVGDNLQEFLQQQRYSIQQYQKAGNMLKARDKYWESKYLEFKDIVSHEVVRPLKEEQMRAAFFFVTQKRAANFSVPGSGKTATMLGIFAYLNRASEARVDRILVICPLNAFNSWIDEFNAEFSGRKELNLVTKSNGPGGIRARWSKANLVLINYESLTSGDIIKALRAELNRDAHRTMIIFDEVHRIKSVEGKRAQAARKLVDRIDFRYVMTGTPIPNGYIDIWQFLHLLYDNEYDYFFGFTQQELRKPDEQIVARINERLSPFFWRTNKDKLGVPVPEPDKIVEVPASEQQVHLADSLYETLSNPLAVMIRLMQLSTNPSLLNRALSSTDIQSLEVDDDKQGQLHEQFEKADLKRVSAITYTAASSPKFERGISLVIDIVKKYGKVIVWALFVDTIEKISVALRNHGIRSEVVYGATPSEERNSIINKFKRNTQEVQVLVTNPNTLGESMSLHQVVHNAVYFEYNYNLTFMLQSRDRIHRLGIQPNQKTRYWYLMTTSERRIHNFIDKRIYRRLKEKEQQMLNSIDQGILQPDYSDEELAEMTEIIENERHM